jgi:hypothetical protein
VPVSILRQLWRERIPDDIRRLGAQRHALNPHDLDEQRALLGCYYLLAS